MEEEKLIEIKVKPTEYQTIMLWRKLKFGILEYIKIHGGVPKKIGKSHEEIILDGNVKFDRIKK